MTREEAKSCIQTIELLRRLAFNVHGVMDVIDAGNCDKIIALLSQEPCEDAISRKAILEEFENDQYHLEFCKEHHIERSISMEMVRIRLHDLPSVNPQPEMLPSATPKAEPCEDCISRQAALDVFGLSEKTRKYGGDHSGYDTMMKYEIQDVIEDLPLVIPQERSSGN